MRNAMRMSAVIAMSLAAGAATAQEVLQVDINALQAELSAPMSLDYTGTIRVFNDPNAAIEDAKILDVLIDGVRQHTGGAEGDRFRFDMLLEFDSGDLLGGSLSLAVDAGASENLYTASIGPAADAIIGFGGIFLTGGETDRGLWADAAGSFLGVDVTPWGSVQPLHGRLALAQLNPGGGLYDEDVDVDLFMVVPAPGPLALLGAGGLLALRRRR